MVQSICKTRADAEQTAVNDENVVAVTTFWGSIALLSAAKHHSVYALSLSCQTFVKITWIFRHIIVVRNLVVALCTFAIRAVASIIQLRVLDRRFGEPFAGLNILSNQLILQVTLFELGLGTAAVSLLYEPIRKQNYDRACELITALRRNTLALTLGATPLVYGFLIIYAARIHSSLSFSTVLAALLLIGTCGLCNLLALPFQVYLNSADRIFQVHLASGACCVLKTVIGLLLASVTGWYLWMPITSVAASVMEISLLWRLFHLSFPGYRFIKSSRAGMELRSKAKFALCHRLSGLLYHQSDFIVLSLSAGLAPLKDYAEWQYISAGILGICSAAWNSMTTSIARSQIAANDGIDRISQYRSASTTCHFVAGALALAYLFTAKDLVILCYGGRAEAETLTVQLFAVLLYLNVIKSVDDTFVSAKGMFHIGFSLPILQPVCYVTLGICLVRQFGVNGILVAGIVTNLLSSVLAKTIVLAKILEISPRALAHLRIKVLFSTSRLIVPLYLWYSGPAKSLAPGIIRFTISNSVTALIVVPICYVLIKRGAWRKADTAKVMRMPPEERAIA